MNLIWKVTQFAVYFSMVPLVASLVSLAYTVSIYKKVKENGSDCYNEVKPELAARKAGLRLTYGSMFIVATILLILIVSLMLANSPLASSIFNQTGQHAIKTAPLRIFMGLTLIVLMINSIILMKDKDDIIEGFVEKYDKELKDRQS